MLWLCLHFPRLSLEVYERVLHDPQPFAVCEGKQLIGVNRAARQCGLRCSMARHQAVAMVPSLLLRERDTAKERDLLERCAAWALSLSPMISLQSPATVVLEIGGSLAYFGGVQAIRRVATEGLKHLGLSHRLGVAPTARAALWLARAGRHAPVRALAELPQALHCLPLQAMALDAARLETLLGLGVKTVGACLELPRSSLARRLGPGLVKQLDQALGRAPECHQYWQPPATYQGALELPVDVAHSGQLLFALNRLIGELCGYLKGRQVAVQRLEFRLCHSDGSTTRLTLGLLRPSLDAEHMRALLQQKLESVQLASPVHAAELAVGKLHKDAPATAALFDDDPAMPGEDWPRLVEKLMARVGTSRLGRLQLVDDHRPEAAWRFVPAGQKAATGVRGTCLRRPLWLMPEPLALKAVDGDPRWCGVLHIEHGPERIESGWWDGRDVARDYYVAVNDRGSRVWIFRDRRAVGAWFLHGLFA